MSNIEGRHSRQITETDGVSDGTAIAWSDIESANRGTSGKHRLRG